MTSTECLSSLPDEAERLKSLRSLLDQAPAPRKREDGFSTEYFLYQLIRQPDATPVEEVMYLLDRLCKKIDVTQRLRTFYTTDLSRNITSETIHETYGAVMVGVLLHFTACFQEYKLLNSTLKIEEKGINNQNIYIPDFLRTWMEQLLIDLRIPPYEDS